MQNSPGQVIAKCSQLLSTATAHYVTNRDYSMRFYTLFSLQQQEIWVAVCGHEHTWQYHKRSHHHHHHHWVDSVKWQNEYNSASMDSNPRIQSLSQILQSRKPGNRCCQSQNCGTEKTVYKVFINETEKKSSIKCSSIGHKMTFCSITNDKSQYLQQSTYSKILLLTNVTAYYCMSQVTYFFCQLSIN